MLYYVDADGAGLDSVEDIVKANVKDIKVIDGGNYDALDKVLGNLVEHITGADLVVIDTLTSLANTIRADAKFENSEGRSLWEYRKKWLEGDKNYLNVYDMAEKMIMRRLKNLRNKGARIIVLCHEAEKNDETTMTKKRGPDLNDAFYGKLMSASSDVFRLYATYYDETDIATGKVIIPAETRILQLRRTEEVIAKVHVTMDKASTIKSKMLFPTLPKLYAHLGKKPSFLTIYGSPGVGKSTFALSEYAMQYTKGDKT